MEFTPSDLRPSYQRLYARLILAAGPKEADKLVARELCSRDKHTLADLVQLAITLKLVSMHVLTPEAKNDYCDYHIRHLHRPYVASTAEFYRQFALRAWSLDRCKRVVRATIERDGAMGLTLFFQLDM